MKHNKWLSLLLALTMLFTCVPVGLFAEGEDTEVVVVEEIPVVEETPVVEEVIEDEEPVAADEPADKPATESAPADDKPKAEEDGSIVISVGSTKEQPAAEENAEEAVEEEIVEEAVEEAAAKTFAAGLAKLSAGDVYLDEKLNEVFGTVNQTAVVYAIAQITGESELSKDDVIRIIANINGEIKTLYVQNGRLTYLNSDEAEAYQNEKHDDGIDYRNVMLDPADFTAAAAEAAVEEIVEAQPRETVAEEPVKETVKKIGDGAIVIEETPKTVETETADAAEEVVEGDEDDEIVEVEIGEAEAERKVEATAKANEVAVGDMVEIKAVATGMVADATYQWQRSKGGSSWSNTSLPGNKTDTLTFEATADRLSYSYRCVVTDTAGPVESEAVKVDKAAPVPVVERKVEATAKANEVAVGETVEIKAVATGMAADATYQWQRSKGGSIWSNTSLPGNKTDTLTFEATADRLSYSYRCVVTDTIGPVESEEVKVDQLVIPMIEAKASYDSVYAGIMLEIHVTTLNAVEPITYQWQRSKNSDYWSNTGLPGNKTDTLAFEVTSDRVSYSYRCIVTDKNGEWSSNAVKVTYNVTPTRISLNQNIATMDIGEELTLTYVLTPQNAVSEITWASTDETVAIVVDGVVTALSQGHTTITATTINGMVDSCDIEIVDSSLIVKDDVTYQLMKNNELCVISYSGNAASVEIPQIVEGYTVSKIGDEAFMNNTDLQSINLPDTITIIGKRAFKGCSNLSEMK